MAKFKFDTKKIKNFFSFNQSQKSIIFMAAFAFVCIFSYYGFINNRLGEMYKTTMELGEKKIIYDDINTFIKDSNGDTSYAGKSANRVLFSQDEVLNFSQKISDVVSGSGAQLISFSPVSNIVPPERTPEMISAMPSFELQRFSFSVSAEGNYQQIIQLFKNIENYEKLLTVSDLQVQYADSGYPKLRVNFNLTIYLL